VAVKTFIMLQKLSGGHPPCFGTRPLNLCTANTAAFRKWRASAIRSSKVTVSVSHTVCVCLKKDALLWSDAYHNSKHLRYALYKALMTQRLPYQLMLHTTALCFIPGVCVWPLFLLPAESLWD